MLPPQIVTSTAFLELSISLLLGLLVGLQRERTATGMPGMRTFPLITVLGTVCALLGDRYGGWVVATGLLAVLVTLAFPSLARLRRTDPDPGITTDVAALLMYAVGALLVAAPLSLPVAIGGSVAVLLQFKPELHRFAGKLGDQDLRAIMQFVVITFIILPVLPDKTYGPLSVLNPFETWLMVVLIVGMSLGGYIAYKFMGQNARILLGGVLGGAISSTATTVSYSRHSRDNPVAAHTAAIVIMIASMIVFMRVLIEIAVVAPEFLPVATPPIVILMVLTMIPALATWYRVRRQPAEMPDQKNPTQLTSAVFFGLMYSVVLLALAVVKRYAGQNALYGVAFLSGLTDMDAITLSTARMARVDRLFAADAWRLLIVAALANLLFKAGIVALLGHRRLLLQVLMMFAVPIVGGSLLFAFWSPPW